MKRWLFSFLNAPLFLILVLLAVSVQSSFFMGFPLQYLQPDFVLLAVIWCALRRNFYEGGVLTLIFARIAELNSSAPQGVFLISYMLVFLGSLAYARLFVIPGFNGLITLTMIASIVFKVINMVLIDLLGSAVGIWRPTLFLLFPGSVMVGIVGIWVYRWLEKFDQLTFKHPDTRQALEDELQFEGEGL